MNLVWLAVGLSTTIAVVLAARSPQAALVRKSKRARYSAWVILFYLLVGWLDQFQIPVANGIPQTPIEIAFSFAEKERTYSAPFADRVLLSIHESADEERNIVRGIHPLGTDANGYDVLYDVARGAGVALKLMIGTMLVSFPLGLALGIIAGYAGGLTDDVIQWIYNTISSIPWLLFVISFLIVFDRNLFWLCLAFGLTGWVDLARLVRGETLKLREMTYIRAAHAMGLSTGRILLRHILPNLAHIFIIVFALNATSIILAESILTFIGIGVQPGAISWGRMLVQAQTELLRSPPVWWVFFGASFLGIFPLVLSLNLFADALRDAFDPRASDSATR